MIVSEKMYELGSKRSAIRELFEYGKKRAAEIGTENVYDFSLGNPTVPAPECVNETIRELTKELDSVHLHGYTSAQGDLETRQAIADYLNKTYQTAFKADNFYMTMGAAASLSLCFKALTTDSEDEFITIAPFFPEYQVFVQAAGAKLTIVPPDTKNFQIDFDALEKAISIHTKGVIINSPNNPSGAVYSEQTIRRLAEFLREKENEYGHPIYLISDEPYREIVYDNVTIPFVPNYYDDTIVCYSFSKSLSLPGERLGYVLVPKQVTDADSVYAAAAGAGRSQGYVNAPSLFQRVAAECCDLTADISVYERNCALLTDALREMGYHVVQPGGAFYLFPRSLEPDDMAFSERAKKFDLLLVPGSGFGAPGHFRIAYCVQTEMIERALPRFKALADFYQ